MAECESTEEYARRRGYQVASLMLPSRRYDAEVTVCSWSPVSSAYDRHHYPQGYIPILHRTVGLDDRGGDAVD